jgi:glutamate-ammonia-ligase adenylyltransferase
LFGRGDSLADPLGSLIFTGVDDHAETLATIEKLGFADAAPVSQTIRGWHHGRIRAMRSERARELLTRLTPRLLRAFSNAGEPDQAFARFGSFFSSLTAGVQVLSLFDARPAFLDLLAGLLTVAPRLADALARQPALLDALIEPHFMTPLAGDDPARRRQDLAALMLHVSNFEDRLNVARRFRREETFRIGVQLLERLATANDSAVARCDLAETCVAAMSDAALAETELNYGKQPGAFAVIALGKFGGRELAARSDLDLMLVYDAPEGAAGPSEFYARLTQRLISALASPTEEGELYEIDTKLRPSGSKGPVAVRLSSFERYYAEEAWTWELQALTRARVVAGDSDLAARVAEAIGKTLAAPRDNPKVLAEVADMRGRMARERRGGGAWDLKLAPGGFVDLEFIVQALQLTRAADVPEVLQTNTGDALVALTKVGVLSAAQGELLLSAWRQFSDLQQVLRMAIEGDFAPAAAPGPLLARVASILGAEAPAEAEAKLLSIQQGVREEFLRIVGPLGDGSAAPAR